MLISILMMFSTHSSFAAPILFNCASHPSENASVPLVIDLESNTISDGYTGSYTYMESTHSIDWSHLPASTLVHGENETVVTINTLDTNVASATATFDSKANLMDIIHQKTTASFDVSFYYQYVCNINYAEEGCAPGFSETRQYGDCAPIK